MVVPLSVLEAAELEQVSVEFVIEPEVSSDVFCERMVSPCLTCSSIASPLSGRKTYVLIETGWAVLAAS